MKLRRANAWISLVTTILLMAHAIFNAVWMLSRGSIEKHVTKMPRILFAVMMIHAILSIILMIKTHKGDKKIKGKEYSKLNIATIIQRISGVSLILLTVLHILGTVGVLQPPKAVHAVLPPLFFAVCLMHTAISTSKAFITLGIGSAKAIKVIDIITKVICVSTLIADVIGFYLYLC